MGMTAPLTEFAEEKNSAAAQSVAVTFGHFMYSSQCKDLSIATLDANVAGISTNLNIPTLNAFFPFRPPVNGKLHDGLVPSKVVIGAVLSP